MSNRMKDGGGWKVEKPEESREHDDLHKTAKIIEENRSSGADGNSFLLEIEISSDRVERIYE